MFEKSPIKLAISIAKDVRALNHLNTWQIDYNNI
jgi:hypothetical protein